MADIPSTLTAWRVGGQIDPAWLVDVAGLAGRTWTSIRATAVLSQPPGSDPIVDPTNGAHQSPLLVDVVLARDPVTGLPSEGQWHTAPLKVTTAADPAVALQPTGLTWRVVVSVAAVGTAYVDVYSYTIALDADRDYGAVGETIEVAGETCVDINALLEEPATLPVTPSFAERVRSVPGVALFQHSWVMVSPLVPGDLGAPWVAPAAGTVTTVTWFVDEVVGGSATVNLVNATTAWGLGPAATFPAGVGPAPVVTSVDLPVAAGDVLYPVIDAGSAATEVIGVSVGLLFNVGGS